MKQTQTERLVQNLKAGPLTYLGMIGVSGSLSPQKRCREWLRRNPEWRLEKGQRGGLVTWRLRRAA
jgi:hypothetical protein